MMLGGGVSAHQYRQLTSVLPYREIGNVEFKISKMFQKGFKLKFLKGHFKIFHDNILIF